jgi:hypothetical protein
MEHKVTAMIVIETGGLLRRRLTGRAFYLFG